MKRLKTKKGIALLVTLVVVCASAIGAYAYWTSGGTGTGSAASGSATSFVVTQNTTGPGSPVTGLVPGGPAQTITIDVNNPATTNEYLTSLAVAVDGAFNVVDANTDPACTAADFTIVQPTVTPTDLAPGDHYYTATIAMKDTGTNQDSCKSLSSIPLDFTAS